MKKKRMLTALIMIASLQLAACSPTCKQSGCDSQDIYKDGYCLYHYSLKKGSDTIRDAVNGIGDFFSSDE